MSDRVTDLAMVDPPHDEPVDSEAARNWWADKYIAMINLARLLQSDLTAYQAENARLRLPPDETNSDHPGCVYCMEAGAPVRPGQVCPKCNDRLPTKDEYALLTCQAELKAAQEEIARADYATRRAVERLARYTEAAKDFPREPEVGDPFSAVTLSNWMRYANTLRAFAIAQTARVKELDEGLHNRWDAAIALQEELVTAKDATNKAEAERDAAQERCAAYKNLLVEQGITTEFVDAAIKAEGGRHD